MSVDIDAIAEYGVAIMLSALALSPEPEALGFAASVRRRRRGLERAIARLLTEEQEDVQSSEAQARAWRAVWDAIPRQAKLAGMRYGEAPVDTAIRFVREEDDAA